MSDCFEIEDVDLLGRVGRLKTRRGVVETPALAPVVDPSRNIVPPSEIVNAGFKLLMTNAYLIRKRLGELGVELGVHSILGVSTPVMTDSGAYQLMEYGEVEVAPLEIVEYQVKLGSDIGVILDIPTRHGSPREVVEREVEETLRRAREALGVERGGMLLVGPVQGGLYLDIVARAARELSGMDFEVYGVGGPVQLMVNYSYPELVRLVMTAKMNLPPGKPVHLFGAGNPHMLALAVAMGVDLFDSASYALYARDGRYMTPHGVYRLEELEDLPCECPVCSKMEARELRELPSQERVYRLALHNLHVLRAELRRIRNAVREGRLWELVEQRARSHPALLQALREFRRYVAYVERHHYVTKGVVSGRFYYDLLSRERPETYRHAVRLRERYTPPPADLLVLALETDVKPFSRFGWIAELAKALAADREARGRAHVAVLTGAYGVVPLELDSVYPLSQYESAIDLDDPLTAKAVASDATWYVAGARSYAAVLVLYEKGEATARAVVERLRRLGYPAYARRFTSVEDAVAFAKLILRTLRRRTSAA